MLSNIKQRINLLREKARISFVNSEGIEEYNFSLTRRGKRHGISAMLRAKNEEKYIRDCILSIADLFDEIVFIDNGSEDGTLDIVRGLAGSEALHGRLKVFVYPFQIARCGDDHWATAEQSVHSLVYFYNWCLAKCQCDHVVKWDADMIVKKSMAATMIEELKSVRDDRRTLWSIPIQTVYRASDGAFWAQSSEVNKEPRIAPNRPAIRYHKARYWEQLRSDFPLMRQALKSICVFELKDIQEDEFAHWDTREFPTERKRKEYENYKLIKDGNLGDSFERVADSEILYAE